MTGHTQPLPGTLVELECDDVVRRAWVMDVGEGPDVIGLAVAATTGSHLDAPRACAAVFPSEDGAAWRCAVEVLTVDGTVLVGRLGPAQRVQRRRHVRQPVGWDAALSPTAADGDDEATVADAGVGCALPAPGPVRGHLRLVTAPPRRPLPVPAHWLAGTCVDLGAGGARLVLAQRVAAEPGQCVAVRVAIPALGNPVLQARVVEVGSGRGGATTVRVAFADHGRRVEDELAGIVLREQFAARARPHHDVVAPAVALRDRGVRT